MKKFIAALVVACCILSSVPAQAEEVTLSWTNPVQNEDGTSLTNLAGIRIWQLVGETVDTTQTSYVMSELQPGNYAYIATAYTVYVSPDPTADPPIEEVLSVSSKISNTAEKTSTGWLVTNIVVKIVSKTPSGFLLLGVGTIPLGTACDLTQEVNGHYVVPLGDVVWSDPARNAGTAPLPLVVVAQCG